MLRVAAGLVLVVLAASCAPRVPAAPEPLAVAPVPDSTLPAQLLWSWPDLEPPPEGEADPLLHSPWAHHPDLTEDVDSWIARYTRREGAWFRDYLARMARYAPLVDSVLEARELPHSLRYLPIVESGYSTHAVSPASAVGLWQFMASVARGRGLRVDAVVDERRDPVRATPEALGFLEYLYDRFDSWYLALAAYNGGPNRVARLLREHAPLAPPSDSLYLVIRPHLPRETQQFVPKFLAAAHIASRPDRYGVQPVEPYAPLTFDEVSVPDATTLDVVAMAAGVSEDEVRDLNPQLVRGVTPRGRETTLRVPPGTAGRFVTEYARIPPEERVTVTEHVVQSGETLSEIALQYGIRTRELQDANPRVEARRMRPGTRLVVPLVPARYRARR